MTSERATPSRRSGWPAPDDARQHETREVVVSSGLREHCGATAVDRSQFHRCRAAVVKTAASQPSAVHSYRERGVA